MSHFVDPGAQSCAFYALAGLTGFVFGAYFQQESAIRQLFWMIKTDPYVFHHRRKLYPLVSTFRTDHEDRLWNRSKCLTSKIRDRLIYALFDMFNSIFFDKRPESLSPDLLDLIKYGLPSTENLYVHKDYVVSQDLSTNAPKWMCEHLKGNYRKLTTEADGDALHLRYNDVYVLSCGATRVCKAFKREIWRKLEEHVSQMTEKYHSVYVYTGPMYLPCCRPGEDWSLEYQIVDWIPLPMPSHYFKVLIIDPQLPECTPYMEGYIIDNKLSSTCTSNELVEYLCDIAEIERHTGLRFFEGVQSTVRFEKKQYKTNNQPTNRPYFSESIHSIHVNTLRN
ncbi:endonuclease G, mitochondrial isoform X1 [Drosophila navojoa]|uniref:endonuclease G, mitochondrial isoform X1 n=2 Tax=Drosophila navojoa TaxID=7232 RepID=UPI0011BD615F|nr:endonuclease G, mitochondrial isoform X1 [Drosophila navojoa]